MWLKSENLFEFGPLLISKNPEEKDSVEIKGINSSVFRITNNGKFKTNISFHFASELGEGDEDNINEFKAGVFYLEPQKM